MSFRFALGVGLAASTLLLLCIPALLSDGNAFAQTQQLVAALNTVDFLQTEEILNKLPEGSFDARFGKESPKTVLKNAINDLENELKTADRTRVAELESRLQLLRPLLNKQEGRLPSIRRYRIKGKHLQRVDEIFPFGKHHTIENVKSGAIVSFDHRNKVVNWLKTQVVIDNKTGRTSKHAIKANPEVDFFKRIRNVPSDSTEQLPPEKVDGVDAIGFRSVEKTSDGTWTRTYWVDSQSKLPVRVITEFESSRKGLGSSRWIQHTFSFGIPLSDDLFSTDVPSGYTAKDGEILGIQP